MNKPNLYRVTLTQADPQGASVCHHSWIAAENETEVKEFVKKFSKQNYELKITKLEPDIFPSHGPQNMPGVPPVGMN